MVKANLQPEPEAPILDGVNEKPSYGRRLLPIVVDELARTHPERVYATVPISSDVTHGFHDITMSKLALSVNHFAFWPERSFGRSESFETLAYIGISDIRYAIVFLAAVKCGFKLLVPSVRNSSWINLSLLEQTRCTRLLHTIEFSAHAQGLRREKNNLWILAVPSFDNLLSQYSEHYSYKASFERNCWDPVLILQSSGSTGPPKPIQTNHATWAVADNDRNLPTVKDRKNQSYALWNFEGDGGRYSAAFPPFHLGGFMALVVLPIFSTSATVVLAPGSRPPTGHLTSQIMQQYPLRALFCPPTIFEQLVQEPEGLDQAKRLDFILYAGGPLSMRTGDLLSQVTDVCQFYGSTETNAITTLIPRREDWASLEWHPDHGVDMQPSDDDAFELVLHRNPDLKGIRSISCNFPDVDEWHTRDLFRPQPGNPHLWRFHGRKDDIIVLSNGEKFNPVPSEMIIQGHQSVSAALIVGLGRFQAALLIEAQGDSLTDKDALIEAVWPTIELANTQAPGHARIIRSMIAVLNTADSFERAGKGTVIRKMTEKKLAPQIEALYSKNSLGVPHLRLDVEPSLESIDDYVRACVTFSFWVPSLKAEDDLYVLGLDSLKTIEIADLLRSGLRGSDTSWLSTQTIYANPTIQSLGQAIQESLNSKGNPPIRQPNSDELRFSKMASLVNKYTDSLPDLQRKQGPLSPTFRLSAVLTGSTGSLGTQLLLRLLEDSTISKIYCLNRSEDARERQKDGFQRLGVSHSLDSLRVAFIKADYGQAQLGLTEAQYNELTCNVDIIIHNAWKVDFNHSLDAFEPVHIRGVRNFIEWSYRSSRHPHIIFISSISSVGNRRCVQPSEQIAEAPISNPLSAQGTGYAESKNVAECILDIAKNKSGVPVSILRTGQIAGPVTVEGKWSEDEWFPSLIKTSKSLGCLPSYLPDADWIPVDILAGIVLDIAHFAVNTNNTWIYNLVNPNSTPWTTLIDIVLERLGPQIEVVELSSWIDRLLEVNQSNTREINEKPAAKIIDFYRGCEEERSWEAIRYSTKNGICASSRMAELQPVSARWLELWLDRWGYQ